MPPDAERNKEVCRRSSHLLYIESFAEGNLFRVRMPSFNLNMHICNSLEPLNSHRVRMMEPWCSLHFILSYYPHLLCLRGLLIPFSLNFSILFLNLNRILNVFFQMLTNVIQPTVQVPANMNATIPTEATLVPAHRVMNWIQSPISAKVGGFCVTF